MIIAGIDEAGLGPALGPLCTCGAAFRLPENANAATPWDLFAGILGRDKKSSLPLVNDSKIVYTARGLAGLELPVLAFAKNLPAAGKIPAGRDGFLKILGSPLVKNDLPPWYSGDTWELPAVTDAHAVTGLAGQLHAVPEARLLAFSARVRTAKALNRDFSRGENKSSVAWKSVASLIKEFSTLEPQQEETLMVIDKQGGRNFYAAMLGEIFDCPLVETLRESADLSEYRIGHCRFMLVPRADQSAFPVALARMLAKYLRERFMNGLNRWFAERVPGLAPTAGYHGDAPRFYEAVKPVLLKNAIAVSDFWRLR